MVARALAVLLLVVLATPPAARAQGEECNPVDLPEVAEQYSSAGGMIYIQGPFLVRCANGAELRADNGTLDRAAGELVLTGNVFYNDVERSLTSDQATYSRPIRRLHATGNVVFTNRVEGTTIRGPELEYFAEMPDRPEAQVNAGNRPHLTLQPREGADDDDPLEIDADRISIVGQSDLSAFGSVVITRPDLRATGGEARYDGEIETLEVRQNAVVEGEDNTLRGEVIQAQLQNNELVDVRARTDARLESEDLTVTAPDVHLFFENEMVARAIARRGEDSTAARPVALSRDFRLEADSIDALSPAQRLEQVVAIGRARGESVDTATVTDSVALADSAAVTPADSAGAPVASAPSLIDSDWLVGDTIIGYFVQRDSTAAGEESDSTAELERLVARGNAQSLYKIREDDGDAQPGSGSTRGPGVSFVAADVITVRMRDGEVDVTEVVGVYSGLYLDPAPAEEAPADGPPEGGQGRE